MTNVVCHECGAVQKKSGRRSRQHHNRLFGLIDVAAYHWPSDHEFQPENDPEYLRAWLVCKAGYSERKDVSIGETAATAAALQAAIRWAGPHAFIRPHPSGGSVAVYRPVSLKWSKLGQADFAPLAQAVQEIIETVIGVPAEELLQAHEAAA